MDAEQLVNNYYNNYYKDPGEGGRPQFSPEVLAARKSEKSRRVSKAQSLARTVLTHRHQEEYDALYRAAVARVNAEHGPLPGD